MCSYWGKPATKGSRGGTWRGGTVEGVDCGGGWSLARAGKWGVSTSSSTWQPVQRLGDRCLLRWVQGLGFDSLCLANKERSQGLGI